MTGTTDQQAAIDQLSPRVREALRLASQHLPSKEIAKRMALSPFTVDEYMNEARKRLGVATRREAARLLVEYEARNGPFDDAAEPPNGQGPQSAGAAPASEIVLSSGLPTSETDHHGQGRSSDDRRIPRADLGAGGAAVAHPGARAADAGDDHRLAVGPQGGSAGAVHGRAAEGAALHHLGGHADAKRAFRSLLTVAGFAVGAGVILLGVFAVADAATHLIDRLI